MEEGKVSITCRKKREREDAPVKVLKSSKMNEETPKNEFGDISGGTKNGPRDRVGFRRDPGRIEKVGIHCVYC